VRQSIEERKVASLARQYQERGYKVFANLKGYERPQRLGQYEPDLIVERGDERIVIEVVSGMTMKDQHQAIVDLARRAASEKGMRFDLVVTNPRRAKKDKATSAIRQLRRLENNLLDALDFAVERQQVVTFFVVSGVVIDHLVGRLWEDRVSGPIDGYDPVRLASQLFERKLISKSAFDFIKELWTLRNAAIHGSPQLQRGFQLKETADKLKNLALSYAGITEKPGSEGRLH
jgi:REase_AHJR-like